MVRNGMVKFNALDMEPSKPDVINIIYKDVENCSKLFTTSETKTKST